MGDPGEKWLDRFEGMVCELRAAEGVQVTCCWIGPPATHRNLGAAAAAAGRTFAPDLAALYRAADGLQLRWHTLTPGGPIRAASFDGIPAPTRLLDVLAPAGCVNLVPLAELVSSAPVPVRLDPHAADRRLSRLDAFSSFSDAASDLLSSNVWMTHHYGTRLGRGPTPLYAYLEELLVTRGVVATRALRPGDRPAPRLPDRWTGDGAVLQELLCWLAGS